MHDPTEGGVMTGLLEMARAAGSGITVNLDAIPVPEESARLCQEFGLDPLGTIASGAILAAVAAADAARFAETLSAAGYPTTRIGQITAADAELVALRAGESVPWPTFATDEITKLFSPLP
jgi:hydrogenase maturation factor